MKEKLIEALFKKYDFEHEVGVKPTYIEKVKLLKSDHYEHGKELLYNRGIFLIASGQNRGIIDDEQVTLGSGQYVIIATVHPAECKTFLFDKVMKGVYIDLDLQRLQKIHTLMEKQPPADPFKTPKNVVTGTMNEEIESAFNRLMKILLDPQESKILGDNVLDELYYRIINTSAGEHLLQLCCQLTHFSRISTIVDEVQNQLDQEINIDDLAERANMRKANFHKKFKEIYNDSPIQYIKKIRLNKARQYIMFDKMKISDAASKVGYESPAQFSREFKSHFGFPPSELKNQ
ncbi:AraC family transcriptional regulator [Sulfurimonas sp. HSL-3221]|uniref:AraC family transcriptional regulator n=1 Tax=Sulfurimonadaceae TaxID=2771471 RepID=UPI001E3A987A|nr:AraC family transcriptional regulator [Sulfurimonas sp. HSL-3221]UFS63050.1 AraC family transcriptional regulator [Sulfurimonas sp. HSL-3221]